MRPWSVESHQDGKLLFAVRAVYPSPTQDQSVAFELCGRKPLDMVPAELYVRQLWQTLDKILEHCDPVHSPRESWHGKCAIVSEKTEEWTLLTRLSNTGSLEKLLSCGIHMMCIYIYSRLGDPCDVAQSYITTHGSRLRGPNVTGQQSYELSRPRCRNSACDTRAQKTSTNDRLAQCQHH